MVEHVERPNKSSFTPYLLALVLSLHSIVEGLVLGVETHEKTTLVVLVAIISHKAIEAFALGSRYNCFFYNLLIFHSALSKPT